MGRVLRSPWGAGGGGPWARSLAVFLDAAAVLFPVALYVALFMGGPRRWASWWFPLASLGFLFTFLYFFFRGGANRGRTALAMAGLLVAGVAALPGWEGARTAFVLLPLASALFFDAATALLALALVVAFMLPPLMAGEFRAGLILLGAAASAFCLGTGARRIREREAVRGRHRAARRRDDRLSDGLRGERDPEVRDILKGASFTLAPEAVSLFLLQEGELTLRSSTNEAVTLAPRGLIHEVLEEGRPLLGDAGRGEGFSPGYVRRGRVTSLAAAPVKDGGFTLGVLAADSRSPGAFGAADLEALGLFAGQVARALLRKRIQAETERTNLKLEALRAQSARLLSSLETETVLDLIMEAVSEMVSLEAAFFLKDTRGFKLVRTEGYAPPRKLRFALGGSLAGMALENAQCLYISNMTLGHGQRALPFEGPEVGSALAVPVLYGEEPLGVIVLTSPRTDALTPEQIEILSIVVNQAALSLKNSMLHGEITAKAITDGLTGLYNHRHFQELLEKELARVLRSGGSLALLLLDIDHFKQINDTCGHPAGDAVLRKLATILRRTVRSVDVPARYGGEEFAAILVDVDPQGARRTAERIRSKVEGAAFRVDGREIPVTLSVGVASAPRDARRKADLIERADRALYHAKESGRNRVAAWETGGARCLVMPSSQSPLIR
jgi:diguanylate cyclase (GGDEF)-like protein